jgi:photosystem II stability/assembly factor-like uncharacterized protein
MSSKFFLSLAPSLCLAASLMAPALAGAADSINLDPLTRSAAQSKRAQRYLMNTVALAGTRLVAAGERGVVLLSDDGAGSWRQAKSVPVSVTLNRLYFLDDKRGWAVGHGGIVMATVDGGETWGVLLDGAQAAKLESEAALADSGNTQRQTSAKRLLAEGPDKPFFDVYFRDALNGMVVGAFGMIFVTEDGGKTWASAMGRFNTFVERHLYAIKTQGQDTYITGEQGSLFKSTDGGRKFVGIPMPGKGTLFGLVATDAGHLIAYGLRGAVFRLNPDAREWVKVEAPQATFTSGLRLKDGSLVLANEAGQIFRSTNNGNSFEVVPQTQASPVVAMIEIENGTLVLAGVRNLTKLVVVNNKAESKK